MKKNWQIANDVGKLKNTLEDIVVYLFKQETGNALVRMENLERQVELLGMDIRDWGGEK